MSNDIGYENRGFFQLIPAVVSNNIGYENRGFFQLIPTLEQDQEQVYREQLH